MQAIIDLPESVLESLATLARRQGATPSEVIRQIVEDHLQKADSGIRPKRDIALPLIYATQTGTIRRLTGADIDEIFADEDLSS
jgi:hypothetical protein